jgi:hypothetical protein
MPPALGDERPWQGWLPLQSGLGRGSEQISSVARLGQVFVGIFRDRVADNLLISNKKK